MKGVRYSCLSKSPKNLEGKLPRNGSTCKLIVSFVKFYNLLDNRVVTEFSYRMSQGHTGHIICSFLLRSSPSSASGPSPAERTKEIGEVIKALNDNGIEASDLSENEFAKSHVRHLVGGRGSVNDERLFRFGMSS